MRDFFFDNCTTSCDPIGKPNGYEIFNDSGTPTALTPPTVVAGDLLVGGSKIRFADILSAAIFCPADAVAQVDTITPPGSPSTDVTTYGVTISYNGTCAEPIQPEFYNLKLGGTQTPTSIVTAFKNAINAISGVVVASGSTTLILTAIVPGQQFITTVTSDLTLVNTTPNTVSTGSPADLEALGVPASDIDQAGEYQTVLITYREFSAQGADLQLLGCKIISLAVFVEADGAAQTAILSNANTLCAILKGTYSVAGAYNAKLAGVCPCS